MKQTAVETYFEVGPGLPCNLNALVKSRLLVQATSGAGKSWLLRRILEQTSGHIQQIVIDPEGEFSTLRERFDYVLAARHGGDTLADPRTAKLLAERLLELGVSAILDIYELNQRERIQFVKLFLEALVDAPKALWHPVLVVLDEAHVYCPETDKADSSDAVKGLCTRGRKRGFGAVLATQRLPTLAKDAAAMCQNKLIGRTSLDVDMKRAAHELGFTNRTEQLALRDLADGEFFAFGPALAKAVTRVQVGPVATTHPEAGSQLAAVVPPPTAKVKAILAKLSDLPAEAEARERTVADLTREVAELRRQLTQAQRAAPAPAPIAEPKRVPIVTEADRELLRDLANAMRGMASELGARSGAFLAGLEQRLVAVVEGVMVKCRDEGEAVHERGRAEFEKRLESKGLHRILDKLDAVASLCAEPPAGARRTSAPRESAQISEPVEPTHVDNPATAVERQQRIIDTIAMLGVRGIDANAVTVARWLGVHRRNSNFLKDLARLREFGLLEGFTLTDRAHPFAFAMRTGRDAAREVLSPRQAAIFDALRQGSRFTAEALAAALGVHRRNSNFLKDLARLRDMGLIPGRGDIYLTEAADR